MITHRFSRFSSCFGLAIITITDRAFSKITPKQRNIFLKYLNLHVNTFDKCASKSGLIPSVSAFFYLEFGIVHTRKINHHFKEKVLLCFAHHCLFFFGSNILSFHFIQINFNLIFFYI